MTPVHPGVDEEMLREYVARPYSRILVPDSAGRYFAEVLEFPGCFSEGDTPGQAMDNLNEAMAAWIEAALDSGQAIPEPIATAGYSGRVLLRLPKSLHREAARRAEMDGVSLNQYLVAAIAARAGADDLADRVAARLVTRLQFMVMAQFGFGVAANEPVGLQLRIIPTADRLEEASSGFHTVFPQIVRREPQNA